jgi:hypothetical protein
MATTMRGCCCGALEPIRGRIVCVRRNKMAPWNVFTKNAPEENVFYLPINNKNLRMHKGVAE